MSDSQFSLLDLFREEVRAHAGTLNQGLLQLETDPTNPQRLEPLMRAAHSIKGAARIVNVEAAVELAHVLEDVFVAAQEGRRVLGPADIDLLLRGTDVLASLESVREDNLEAWTLDHRQELDELKALLPALLSAAPTPTPTPRAQPAMQAAAPPAAPPGPLVPFQRPELVIPEEPLPEAADSLLDLFREEVRQQALTLNRGLLALEHSPADEALLEPLAHAAHAVGGAARLIQLSPAVGLARFLEQTLIGAREGGTLDPGTRECLWRGTEILVDLINISEETQADWCAQHEPEIAALAARLEAVPPATKAPEPEPERALVVKSPALAVALPAAPVREALPVEREQGSVSAVASVVPVEASEAVVRVTAQSLNRLMSLAGESLVQARWLQPFSTALLKLKKQQDRLAGLLDNLAQTLSAESSSDLTTGLLSEARQQSNQCRQVLAERMSEFEDHAARAEDLNSRLYREVIVSRMRPFSDGAHGFPRLVRDMARRLNKQVRLEILGQHTEVDRDILDRLEAPLTHLLRNAVDHGIETPEARALAGKSETGLLRLEVRHRAGMLAITLSDDGGGIDLEKLRRKVVERGLNTAEVAQALTEPELLEFLFLPGFSTAPAVTEYSGRGVGLDVVQNMVRQVGGSVHITSTLGRGTAFHLQLPITLSVLRAVLVEIAGEPYAFPHNRIDRLLQVPRSALQSLEHRQFLNVDGHNVGLALASQLLELPGDPPEGELLPVLLLSDQSGQYGLLVDAFRGEQDLVVRPLDARLGKVPNVSAAAILDDGSPVLIADVEDLIRSLDQFIQGGVLRRCERQQPGSRPRKRILVVDDSITVREVERQLLSNRGYEVAVAVDGQEGWNLVRAERFDLVLSDVDMPRMNGLELVRAIRDDGRLKDLPVIIVSYKEREEDRLRGLEVGANRYLTKSSFRDNTLLQAIEDLIGESG